MPLVVPRLRDRIILGLMTIGPDKAAGARITSLEEYNRILDYFQEQGYNEVDTARSYVNGAQEAFTAAANWKDRGLTLATKHYPFAPGQHSPDKLKAALNKSLGELKTETVDIFYLHAADRSVPFKETLQAVNELHKEGKFVRLGLSNFTSFEVAEVVLICQQNGWVRPTIYQGMYNAITRSLETELIPACHRYGLDVVVYNPLAGGLFSGKLKLNEVPSEGRFSDSGGNAGQRYRERYFKDATFDALRIIEPVVAKHGLTLIETALRWCVHHSALKIKDGNDGIIIGISSFDQLKSNLADAEKGPLPDEVVKVLDEAWSIAKTATPNYYHLDLKYTYDTQKALFG
ncbi:Aldo/keto reductase [Trichodelitschia bisporula]|uniref:Aldo/keto reductase n=1 Tax=Trichodelitschia bisporula TaxID=703511 RepID=A0A6G1HP29_9PEZI|nr:Aldo/keto reductase [Trichodelitschia bisporula]